MKENVQETKPDNYCIFPVIASIQVSLFSKYKIWLEKCQKVVYLIREKKKDFDCNLWLLSWIFSFEPIIIGPTKLHRFTKSKWNIVFLYNVLAFSEWWPWKNRLLIDIERLELLREKIDSHLLRSMLSRVNDVVQTTLERLSQITTTFSISRWHLCPHKKDKIFC